MEEDEVISLCNLEKNKKQKKTKSLEDVIKIRQTIKLHAKTRESHQEDFRKIAMKESRLDSKCPHT